MNDKASKLADTFNRARQLTQLVARPEFNEYARNLKDGGYIDSSILSETYASPELTPYNPSMPSMASTPYSAEAELQKLQTPNTSLRRNTGLPKSILEEIQNNPLTGLSADPKMDAFVNKISESMPPRNNFVAPNNGTKPTLTEQFMQKNPSQPIISNGGGFDYEMLKMIVEGVVKKYVEPLKENMLTENKNTDASLKMMKIGKNFQFMDSTGNIYEAVLKYKGNINEMKKKKSGQ